MQISTNQFFTSNQLNFKALTTQADILQTQISTGKVLNAPSDNAVGYRRLQGLIRDGSNDKAYSGNITIVQSALSQADTTIKSMTDDIQRAQELAIKANSGTLSASDRSIIADELDSIVKGLVTLANAKDSRGASIFAAGDSPAVTANPDGTFTIATTGPTTIPIGDSSSAQPGDSAARLFVDSSGGNILSDISALSAALRGTGSVGTIAGTTSDKLTASNNQIAGVQGALGARGQRVDIESTRITDAATDREITRSSIEDVDPTQAITELQKTMTILSAAQSSFAKLSGLSLFNYLN